MKDAIKDVCDGEIGLSKLIIMLIYIVWGQLPAKKSIKNLDRTHAPPPMAQHQKNDFFRRRLLLHQHTNKQYRLVRKTRIVGSSTSRCFCA